MGVTIHYRGRLDRLDDVVSLTEELNEFAQILGWETRIWREDWTRPNTSRIVPRPGSAEIVGYLPLRGVTLFPHKDCEPVSLTFESHGYLIDPPTMASQAERNFNPRRFWVSTKTQFAPISIHVAIIKLFRHLGQRYICNLEVVDDGGYWESGDVARLQERISKVERAMDRLETGLRMATERGESAEETVQAIENIINQLWGKHE